LANDRVATLPTTVDLAVLYSGRGQLLKVAEVAKKLGVCSATVYRLCESGALPHVRVVNSIRVRPRDLAEYLGGARGRGVE
jgi:excisionase family DNA binding protein